MVLQLVVMPPRELAPDGQNTACAAEPVVTPIDDDGIASPVSGQITWWKHPGRHDPGHSLTDPMYWKLLRQRTHTDQRPPRWLAASGTQVRCPR
ncbi:MAG: hypothetical protein U0325_27440 [Polyangiales bacterium]